MPAIEARKLGKSKQASAETAAAETLAPFAVDCNDVLAFLQAVAVKSPDLSWRHSLFAKIRKRVWFQRCTDVHLPKPPIPAPQDHTGLTYVLADGVLVESFGFPDFLPSEASVTSTVTTLSLSLASSASLGGDMYEAHSVIDWAKIFRSSPASDLPWRMATSVRKVGRRKGVEGLPVPLLFGAC